MGIVNKFFLINSTDGIQPPDQEWIEGNTEKPTDENIIFGKGVNRHPNPCQTNIQTYRRC